MNVFYFRRFICDKLRILLILYSTMPGRACVYVPIIKPPFGKRPMIHVEYTSICCAMRVPVGYRLFLQYCRRLHIHAGYIPF